MNENVARAAFVDCPGIGDGTLLCPSYLYRDVWEIHQRFAATAAVLELQGAM